MNKLRQVQPELYNTQELLLYDFYLYKWDDALL